MSVTEIFNEVEGKLHRKLASPLSDILNRNNTACNQSIVELQELRFSNKMGITQNGNNLCVGTLEADLVTQNITAKQGQTIDFNNSTVQRIAFGDPMSSTDPVNKRTLDSEIAVLNSSIDKINNYLLILSATYIIKDQNGVAIKF